jgi:hypothetical protein
MLLVALLACSKEGGDAAAYEDGVQQAVEGPGMQTMLLDVACSHPATETRLQLQQHAVNMRRTPMVVSVMHTLKLQLMTQVHRQGLSTRC